ncbi:unnamed protein product, partial [Allacma fusca]
CGWDDSNHLLYIFVQHSKKTPIAREDIVINAIDCQVDSFTESIKQVSEILEMRSAYGY